MASELPARPPTNPRNYVRRVLEVFIGAVIGLAAACALGPDAVSFWYQPPSGDAFSCAGSVRGALAQFVKLQLICAVGGGAGLALALFFSRRLWRKRGADSAEQRVEP